jgi:hypothetical protein
VLQLFKNQEPRSLVLLLVLLVVTRIPWLVLNIPMPGDINSLPERYPDLLLLLISMVLVFLQALWINYIFTQANFVEQRTMVPAAVWIVITLLDKGFMMPGSPLVLGFIVTGLMYTLMDIRQEEASANQAFNGGFLTGFGAAIHPPFILLIPFTLAGLYNLKTFSIRAYVIALLGVAVPLFWAWSVLYLSGDSLNWWSKMQQNFGLVYFDTDIFRTIGTTLVLLFSAGGAIATFGVIQSAGFKRKKNVRTTFILIGGLILVFAVSVGWPFANSLMLLPPMTMLISILLLRINKALIAEVLFGIFALSLLTIQILSSIT